MRLPFDGSAAGEIGIAIRPEKARVSTDRPEDADCLSLEGSVTQVAYHGSESHVFVKTDRNLTFSVAMANRARGTEPPAKAGDRRWVTWRRQDTLVLVE